MKYNCNIVSDLLPLYVDKLTSNDSNQMIEEHIKECEECKKRLIELKDNEPCEAISVDSKAVLEEFKKVYKKRTITVGGIFSCIFLIPIIVCLIVNLASTKSLDWFFIVLTALMTGGSLILIPLLVNRDKFIWSMLGFIPSLILLFLVCNIYTSGNWFFIATTASLLFMELILFPIFSKNERVAKSLPKFKGLISIGVITTTFYLMGLSLGLDIFKDFFRISLPLVILAWILFAEIRYIKLRKAFSWAIVLTTLGCYIYLAKFIWKLSIVVFNMSGEWIAFAICIVLSLVLILIGLIKKKGERKL